MASLEVGNSKILNYLDGVEFDVCNGMHQGAVAFQGKRGAPWHILGLHQLGPWRATGGAVVGQTSGAIQQARRRWCQCQHGGGLLYGIGEAKNLKAVQSQFHPYNSRQYTRPARTRIG